VFAEDPKGAANSRDFVIATDANEEVAARPGEGSCKDRYAAEKGCKYGRISMIERHFHRVVVLSLSGSIEESIYLSLSVLFGERQLSSLSALPLLVYRFLALKSRTSV